MKLSIIVGFAMEKGLSLLEGGPLDELELVGETDACELC